jgi:ribonuclease P protein component
MHVPRHGFFIFIFPMAGFTRIERIKRKTEVEALFAAKSWVAHPFRIYWQWEDSLDGTPALPRILVAVPKRTFRKAHQRNRIKRQIREAYRLQKHYLFPAEKLPSSESMRHNHSIGFLYIAKRAEPWETIISRMGAVLEEIHKKSLRIGYHD